MSTHKQEVPAIVLFDWDGTLCDSGAASLRAFRKSMGDFGIEFTDERYKTVYTPRWYQMYDAFALPRDQWAHADQRWLYHYQNETPALIAGAPEVLAEVHRRGIRTGVVTNGTRPRIEKELACLELQSTFGAVVCHEDVGQSKPHPEGIHKALAMMQCSGSCWYVGDTPIDIEQGRNAGVFTVGILTDFVDPRRLEESRPDLLLRSISELPEALYRLTSTTSSNSPAGS